MQKVKSIMIENQKPEEFLKQLGELPGGYCEIPNNLKNNKNIMLKAIEINPLIFRSMSNNLKADVEIVEKVILKSPSSIRHASEAIKDNKRLVKVAIGIDPFTIEYASRRLRCNTEIAKYVLQKNINTFRLLGKSITSNREFVIPVLEKSPENIVYVNQDLLKDIDIVNTYMESAKKTVIPFLPYYVFACNVFMKKVLDKIDELSLWDISNSIHKRHLQKFEINKDFINACKEFYGTPCTTVISERKENVLRDIYYYMEEKLMKTLIQDTAIKKNKVKKF